MLLPPGSSSFIALTLRGQENAGAFQEMLAGHLKRNWASLNSSVDGRLIATIPLASPCHDPNHNAALCTSLQQNWFLPPQQSVPQFPTDRKSAESDSYNSSSSIMAPYFAGNSCDPFTPESMPCTLGKLCGFCNQLSPNLRISRKA